MSSSNELKKIRLNTFVNISNDIKSFNCGDVKLNDFFYKDALGLDEENNLATVIYYDEEYKKIAAFYTLSASSIQMDENDSYEKSKVKETMTEFSAIKIHYFAVDVEYQNQGLGKQIMTNLFSDLIDADFEYNIGFKVLYLEALLNAMDFYSNVGFNYLKPWEEPLNLSSSIMLINYEDLEYFYKF
ncbi:GNAT family N-acetyltransferase [Companilactobacillus kedongensis]|uniref:GNAT family N-acetyltransferase n=1 Tax=Companilactobacillus kedongensis TaxID=2486004 RepID=UPI000F77C17C|nr:GNAT family N-acetyltransferase [Companilactobacillus kedongensis]